MGTPDAARPATARTVHRPANDRAGGAIDFTNTVPDRTVQALRRVGNSAACLTCGAPLHRKRAGRRPRYCGDGCKQSAFRARKWAGRYEIPAPLRNERNNDGKSTACNSRFGDLASHISGPAGVIEWELIRNRHWTPITSPDGVSCLVAKIGAAS